MYNVYSVIVNEWGTRTNLLIGSLTEDFVPQILKDHLNSKIGDYEHRMSPEWVEKYQSSEQFIYNHIRWDESPAVLKDMLYVKQIRGLYADRQGVFELS